MKTRWYKYLTVLFVFLFIFPLNSKAECDYKRMAELNKIASNVQVVYNYDVGQDSIPIFKLNIGNITNDIYVEDGYGNIYENNVENTFIYNGSDYSFTIFSKDAACFGEKLLVKHLKVPVFNNYFLFDECINSNRKECGVWFDSSNISSLDFDKSDNDKALPKNNDIKNDVKFLNYLYIGIIIFIVVFVLLLIFKRRRKKL